MLNVNNSRPSRTCSVRYEVRLGINVNNNSNTRYLSPELSVAKLYRLYLEKYEPEFWALYNTEQSESREITMKPLVKYAYFANYFASNFNISFSYPRSDTCQTCDQLLKSIQNERNT